MKKTMFTEIQIVKATFTTSYWVILNLAIVLST
jgi:hypothetical protein